MTEIISNGSKGAGESPDKVSELIRMLANYPLDSTFEKYGNFGYKLTTQNCGQQKEDVGKWHFFGNFRTYSHVFNIVTDNKALSRVLYKAIRANQKRPDYASR